MNKSIRILNIPEAAIEILEEKGINRIFDLIKASAEENLPPEWETFLNEHLEDYKIRQLKKELKGKSNVPSYTYLDTKYTISQLDLPLRSYNALMNRRIDTISKLLFVIEDMEIYHIENLGAKSIVHVMNHVNKMVEKENLGQTIPVFAKHHPLDSLTIRQMGFSQGAITSLSNLGLDTLGDIRLAYVSGKLADYFNYKTLKVVIGEFAKYFADKNLHELNFFKLYLIEKKLGVMPLSEFKDLFKEQGFSFFSENILDLMKDRTDIVWENNLIRLPYLIEKLKEMPLKKETEKILMDRFSGQTLQAIADKFGKTRERIRQIVRDRMNQISFFFEESFVKEYNKFTWHPEVFRKVYGLNEFSYYVVKYLSRKIPFEEEFVFPENYLNEMFDKGVVERFDIEAFKISLPEVFHPRIDIYGVSVEKMTKRGFLEYVIEHFVPKEGMHKSKIVKIANQVAQDNQLDYNYDKYIDIVTNTIQGLQNIRYYDYSRITDSDLEELKKIIYSVDSVYSCTYFYRTNKELMERLDIRDGYELHCVLRRYFAKSPEFADIVDFNRQPMIAVKGKSYSDLVIEKWQELTKPINLDRFAEKLIHDYGFHSGTLINIINLTLGDYISLRTLYPDKPILSQEVADKIRDIMNDEFYELGEIKKIFREHGILEKDYQFFSNFWLKDFGYKTHDVNYIIKKKYASLKEVFYTQVLQKPIYKITAKDHKMRETTLILFIETLRQEYLAFLQKAETLVTMKYLETQGVREQDLRDYVQALTDYLPKDEYFTYESLLKNEYYKKDPIFAKVENYRLDKAVMIDLIRNVPNIKKTTKGDLFRISSEQTTVSDFIDEVSELYQIFDKKELKMFIKDNYGIVIKKYGY